MVITKDDYFKFKGIDLDLELKNSGTDNPTKATQIYIDNVRDFVLGFVNDVFVQQDNRMPNETEVLKFAILHQIAYFIEHGDLTIFNPNGLPILSPNSHRLLRAAGMANTRRF